MFILTKEMMRRWRWTEGSTDCVKFAISHPARPRETQTFLHSSIFSESQSPWLLTTWRGSPLSRVSLLAILNDWIWHSTTVGIKYSPHVTSLLTNIQKMSQRRKSITAWSIDVANIAEHFNKINYHWTIFPECKTRKSSYFLPVQSSEFVFPFKQGVRNKTK